MEACQELKDGLDQPTLFFHLVPTDESHSPFIENDVLELQIPKSIFRCEQGIEYRWTAVLLTRGIKLAHTTAQY